MDIILKKAKECHDIFGVYPISFSFPHRINNQTDEEIEKTKILATVIPDKKETYVFETEKEYYHDYKTSRFGATNKKCGWDCMRHLEIMYNYCLPLFVDIDACPHFNMIHYPKNMISSILLMHPILQKNDDIYISFIQTMVSYFNSFLTCERMIQYALAVSGLNQVATPKILFIDSNLPSVPDYLSVCTLIGLKQNFLTDCEVLYPVDYIYKETTINTQQLYGKGFSYTRVLDSTNHKTTNEWVGGQYETIKQNIIQKKYDFIVYGSIGRCLSLFSLVQYYYKPGQILGFFGEDIQDKHGDPRPFIIKEQVKAKMTLFVREFENVKN